MTPLSSMVCKGSGSIESSEIESRIGSTISASSSSWSSGNDLWIILGAWSHMKRTIEKRNSEDEEEKRRFTGNSIPERLLIHIPCVSSKYRSGRWRNGTKWGKLNHVGPCEFLWHCVETVTLWHPQSELARNQSILDQESVIGFVFSTDFSRTYRFIVRSYCHEFP